jgi:hypothetical protein
VPGAVSDDRLTLDETSLDFRNLSTGELECYLNLLNETLDDLRRRGLTVRVHPWMWSDVECLDGCILSDFLYKPGVSGVNQDTLRLLGVLLDRCPSWDEDEPGFLEQVQLKPGHSSGDDGALQLDLAFSLGVVLARASNRAMACLVFGACTRRGPWSISGMEGAAQTHFFANALELPTFWRSLYQRERVTEQDFFELADYAFPTLVLHPSLSFGRFDGQYSGLRDHVVKILGVLDDHFAAAVSAGSGIPHQVAAVLGQFGVEVSPESPTTRGSQKLMASREVVLDGRTYRCEWHAKVEPHRNRIHFSLPVPDLDGRVVVGIFVDHLDTMTNQKR